MKTKEVKIKSKKEINPITGKPFVRVDLIDQNEPIVVVPGMETTYEYFQRAGAAKKKAKFL